MSGPTSSYPFSRFMPLIAATTLVLAFSIAGPLMGDTVFTDTFDGSSYSTSGFNSADSGNNPDDTSSAILDVLATGGNPGGVGSLDHFHDVDRDGQGEPPGGNGFTSLQSFHTNQTFSYTPSVDGTIVDITFSLDYRTFDPDVSSVFFGVSDSNGGNFAGFTTPVTSGEWETVTTAALTQSDFSSRDFAGSQALEFEFGFISDAEVFFEPTNIFVDVDNFVVTINSIPEPGAVAMLLLGLMGMACGRKRG